MKKIEVILRTPTIPEWKKTRKWRQKPLKYFFTDREISAIFEKPIFQELMGHKFERWSYTPIQRESFVRTCQRVSPTDITNAIKLTREKKLFKFKKIKVSLTRMLVIPNHIICFLNLFGEIKLSSSQICDLLPLLLLDLSFLGKDERCRYGIPKLLHFIFRGIPNFPDTLDPLFCFFKDEAEHSWFDKYGFNPKGFHFFSSLHFLSGSVNYYPFYNRCFNTEEDHNKKRGRNNSNLEPEPDRFRKMEVTTVKKIHHFFFELLLNYDTHYSEYVVQGILERFIMRERKDLFGFLPLMVKHGKIDRECFNALCSYDSRLDRELEKCKCRIGYDYSRSECEKKNMKKKGVRNRHDIYREKKLLEAKKMFEEGNFEGALEKCNGAIAWLNGESVINNPFGICGWFISRATCVFFRMRSMCYYALGREDVALIDMMYLFNLAYTVVRKLRKDQGKDESIEKGLRIYRKKVQFGDEKSLGHYRTRIMAHLVTNSTVVRKKCKQASTDENFSIGSFACYEGLYYYDQNTDRLLTWNLRGIQLFPEFSQRKNKKNAVGEVLVHPEWFVVVENGLKKKKKEPNFRIISRLFMKGPFLVFDSTVDRIAEVLLCEYRGLEEWEKWIENSGRLFRKKFIFEFGVKGKPREFFIAFEVFSHSKRIFFAILCQLYVVLIDLSKSDQDIYRIPIILDETSFGKENEVIRFISGYQFIGMKFYGGYLYLAKGPIKLPTSKQE